MSLTPAHRAGLTQAPEDVRTTFSDSDADRPAIG